MRDTAGIRQELAARVLPFLPEKMRRSLVPSDYSWSWRDLRVIAKARPADKRLLIAPANYGGQAYQWARAADLLPGVSAVNMRYLDSAAVIRGPSDFTVDKRVGRFSHLWAKKQREVMHEQFTHVLIEAELPLLGPLHNWSLAEEVKELRDHGIKVGLISHGSDVRTPSTHKALEPDSPFQNPLDGLTESLEISAGNNNATMDRLDLPEFVSTPDLLEFRPNATWLPLAKDPEPWVGATPTQLSQALPVVAHIPGGNPALKGTSSIRAAMQKLDGEGLIRYVELTNVAPDQMPAALAQTDIVINQVDMGLYAAVAVEAMLSGRIVVAHVWDSVRHQIEDATGYPLPIVQASQHTLYEVVRHIVQHPDEYKDLGTQSRLFATKVHSREHAATILAPFLGVADDDARDLQTL